MTRNFGFREVFLVVITVIIVTIAYLLDNWLERLRLEGASSFNIAPALWGRTLTNVFLAGILLLLGWYALKGRKNLIIALFFVVFGAILGFNPVLVFIFDISFLPFQTTTTLDPTSFFVIAGAFLMVIGLLMFILDRRT